MVVVVVVVGEGWGGGRGVGGCCLGLVGTNLSPTKETSDLRRMTVSLFEITGKRKLLLSYFLFS